jgi:SAM-dependent methyltransferase
MSSGFKVPAELASKALPVIRDTALNSCAICGEAASSVFASGMDYELQTCGNVWTFRSCDHCGHVQLNPRPHEDTLPIIYPKSYYSYNFEAKINPIALRAKAMLDKRKLEAIFSRVNAPRAYLDVGCGSGRFLWQARQLGLGASQVAGLELDSEAAARLADAGFDVRPQRVEVAEFGDGRFDVVTMFHVIEHLANPFAALEKINGWMTSGGVLAIETPNLNSLDARWFKPTYWGGYHIPRHWHLFNESTLTRLLEDCGFDVQEVKYTTGHSFWLYSFHHLLRYNSQKPLPVLARRFDPLRSLVALSAVTAFDLLRSALGAKTSSMLLIARKR